MNDRAPPMKPTPTQEMIDAGAKAMFAHGDEGLWQSCTSKDFWRGYAEAALSAALSVPAAAVVGEPVAAYHVKVKGYGEELCFTEDGANSLVQRIRRTKGQHGVATITPLYATLPNEALERSEQSTFDIAARLLKERDALASRISQQDAELERLRREVEEVRQVADDRLSDNARLTNEKADALFALAEARKAAFIEAAEIAEKVAAGQDQEWRTDTAMRVAYAIRAKAEGENHG